MSAYFAEVYFLNRSFLPIWGTLMLVCWGLAFAARITMLKTMSHAWNARIIKNSRQIVVCSGFYRYIRHPNYLIVIIEIFCIPMIHNAYWTACLGALLNAFLIRSRLQKEEAYLNSIPEYRENSDTFPVSFRAG